MSNQQQVESAQQEFLASGARAVPLPPTAAWASKLPIHLRPHALLRQCAPLADLLALDWDDAAATDEHLTDLLLGRGNRELHLPEEVRSELLALKVYYESRMRLMPASWTWRNVG